MTVPETTNLSTPSFLDRLAFFRVGLPKGSYKMRYCGLDERETRLIIEDRIALLREVAPKLRRKLLALEAQLTTTKWFDYSFTDSVSATKLFAAEYQVQYRRAWDINIDRSEAGKKRGLPTGNIFAGGRELTGLWRARQEADRYGIPYDFFIRQGIEACVRRGCKRFPRPNQLLDPRTIETVGLAWAEQVSNRLWVSKLPQYRNEAFDDHPIQRAHHDWIVDLIKERHSNAGIIGQLCFIDKVLTVERATLEFGEDTLSEAQKCLIGEPVPYSDDIFLDLHPACFAVPHAYQPNSLSCAACPKREACRTMEGEVRAAITDRHGSDDPVRDYEREATAARVRKHREKKRLAKLTKA